MLNIMLYFLCFILLYTNISNSMFYVFHMVWCQLYSFSSILFLILYILLPIFSSSYFQRYITKYCLHFASSNSIYIHIFL